MLTQRSRYTRTHLCEKKKTWISSESWQNKNKCKGREPRRESIFTSRAFLNASKCVSCAILNACQHFLAFSATLSCFSLLLSLSLCESSALSLLSFSGLPAAAFPTVAHSSIRSSRVVTYPPDWKNKPYFEIQSKESSILFTREIFSSFNQKPVCLSWNIVN